MSFIERFTKKQLKQELTMITNGELREIEHNELRNILGAKVEVKLLPDYVTPEIIKNLHRFGFNKIIYSKKLHGLTDADYIKTEGVENCLKEIELLYPKLRIYESLSNKEKIDHSIPRMLQKWYLQNVLSGNINICNSSDVWLAIETVHKPDYKSKYIDTLVADMLRLDGDRFIKSCDAVDEAIEKEKSKVLRLLGLSGTPATLRMLEADEWNQTANRLGWGKTDTCEWTNTKYRHPNGRVGRVIAGHSNYGGAGYARGAFTNYQSGGVGWRVAIVLNYE